MRGAARRHNIPQIRFVLRRARSPRREEKDEGELRSDDDDDDSGFSSDDGLAVESFRAADMGDFLDADASHAEDATCSLPGGPP